MTATEAFELLVRTNYKTPLIRCRSCLDFGSFFVFCVAPMNVRDTDSYFTGTTFEAVDKKTGKIFDYDITSDVDAYENAKNIHIDSFLDTPLSSVQSIE